MHEVYVVGVYDFGAGDVCFDEINAAAVFNTLEQAKDYKEWLEKELIREKHYLANVYIERGVPLNHRPSLEEIGSML